MALVPITETDVQAIAPELTKLTPQAWVEICTYVNKYDLTKTGEDAQTDRMMKLYLAAHMATMAKQGSSGTAGPVTSISVDGVRRSFGLLASTYGLNSLSATRYGLLYEQVIGSSLAALPLLV